MSLPAWHLHADVWAILGSVVAVYVLAVRRHDAAMGQTTSRRSRRMFLGGMAVLWVASGWPVHDLAERYLFSVHMTQHLLFTMVAAPLLVAGIPVWMWRVAFRRTPLRIAWRFLTRPVTAFVVFNGVLLFTHWPAVVTASVGSEITHLGVHLLVVGSALVMWWPVVSPLPEMPPITPPAQMLYLFFQSLAPTIPASFLTFGTEPLYPVYATFPRIWGIAALDDQLLAGLIMKLAGGAILWTVIAVVFFRWGGREQREGWDALQWRDADAEIRAGVSR